MLISAYLARRLNLFVATHISNYPCHCQIIYKVHQVPIQWNCYMNPTPTLAIFKRNFQQNITTKSKDLLESAKNSVKAAIINNHNRTVTSDSISVMATLISGTKLSSEIKARLKVRVEQEGLRPKLAIVQVGNREDSNVYIRMKIQFAETIGAEAIHIRLPNTISEVELVEAIKKLNQDTSVHGIITQLPFDCVSKDIDADMITNLIDPSKDVDGLSVVNAGKLLHGVISGSSFIPCTPNGCLEMIKNSGIKIEGTRSVVIGRSKIVGGPMAQLLVWNNSTVTICHSRTSNLEAICREADILVVAVGRAQMVKRSWIKPGAVVIDCGINCIPDATKKSGTRLVGDVDFEECKTVAGAITPVPGGVGPMTVAMLINNTVESASRAKKQ